MWLKIVIVVLFLAVLVSLSSALFFLLRDMGAPNQSVRCMHWESEFPLPLYSY
ncbi:DUF2909 family protein [Microbulbifer sp. MLAF003]|uniref:DUF2909 family protein n=1 Tax=Microbulbifer sp. MLAF003 TaxID=3032582 RepID=UPI0024AD37C3|nr:DUF2909 family protein [Microbulbifer sp. MLAF003]WHI51197.1 DUF2909 family protein [Microbulbifer sp. MLAF003]